MPMLEMVKEYSATASAIVGVLVVVVGAAFWLKDLDNRIVRLEKQQGGNPVQFVCAGLAKKVADQGYTEREHTKDAMNALGCSRAGSP